MSVDNAAVGRPTTGEQGDGLVGVVQDLTAAVELDVDVVASEVAVIGWRHDGTYTLLHYFDDGGVVRLA